MRTLGLWVGYAVFLLAACHHNETNNLTQPVVDPVTAEERQIAQMKEDSEGKLKSEAPDVANALAFLELEAQARFAIYQTEHPDEAKAAQVSSESAQIRIEIGRYLSEMRKRK